MARDIIIATGNSPTPVSRKAWSGAFTGYVIGQLGVLAAGALNPLAVLAIAAVPPIIGYVMGRRAGVAQQQRELREGRRSVPAPSFFNSGLAKGWIMGDIASTALFIGAAALTGIAGPVAAMGASALAILGGVAIVAMPILGSLSERKQMQQEYGAARAVAETARSRAVTTAVGQTPDLQPDLSLAADQAQSYSDRPGFVATEKERRAAAARAAATAPQVG